jgi:hypothetical protein
MILTLKNSGNDLASFLVGVAEDILKWWRQRFRYNHHKEG